jgi:transposase
VVLRAEFRSLPPLERALKLATEVPLNQTEISKVCGISRFTLHRAKKAQKEGRKPGNNGRSPLLNEEEIIEFGKILEREAQGPYRLDYQRIKALVSSP